MFGGVLLALVWVSDRVAWAEVRLKGRKEGCISSMWVWGHRVVENGIKAGDLVRLPHRMAGYQDAEWDDVPSLPRAEWQYRSEYQGAPTAQQIMLGRVETKWLRKGATEGG